MRGSRWISAVLLLLSMTARASAQDISELTKRAESGDPNAQVLLGLKYESGEDVPEDYSLALKWYREAANKNNPSGECQLARLYKYGNGITKNEIEALRLTRLSAGQGNARCQRNLGFMYEYGEAGLTKDTKEAVSWYRKGAAQGDSGSEYALGHIYAEGDVVVPLDYSEAARWFRRAAEESFRVPFRNWIVFTIRISFHIRPPQISGHASRGLLPMFQSIAPSGQRRIHPPIQIG